MVNKRDYDFEVIMPIKDYMAIHKKKMKEKLEEQRLMNKVKRFIGESVVGQYICPCLKPVTLENLPWD